VTSWLIQCDDLTVRRVGRVTSWLWQVDFMTSWPCDELFMWRVDWQPITGTNDVKYSMHFQWVPDRRERWSNKESEELMTKSRK